MTQRNADRDAAIASGGRKYMGQPCKHGHSGLRYVARWSCVECAFEAKQRARAERRARG